MINEYDDRLLQIEQMIERGEVYAKYNKNRPCLKVRVTISDTQIRQAIDDTKTWAEIGTSLGISESSAKKRAKALGIQKKKLSADQIRSVFEQYAETKTWEEMGNILGISKQNLIYHAKRIGLVKDRTKGKS